MATMAAMREGVLASVFVWLFLFHACNTVRGDQLQDMSADINTIIMKSFSFCIENVDEERTKTFQVDSRILDQCSSDAGAGLCTRAEIQLYMAAVASSTGQILVPKNGICNPDNETLIGGCEPGYYSIGKGLQYPSVDLPTSRIKQGRPCCPGFFCPKNLACMLPCPVGSRCGSPSIKNPGNAFCVPYLYQSGPNSPDCAGADIWGIAGQQEDIFCPGGSYCPTTTKLVGTDCPSNNFCRKGVTNPTKCSLIASCPAASGAPKQDLHTAGLAFVIVFLVVLGLVYWGLEVGMDVRRQRAENRRSAAQAKVRARQMVQQRWLTAVRAVIRQYVRPALEEKRKVAGPTSAGGVGLIEALTTPVSDGDMYGATLQSGVEDLYAPLKPATEKRGREVDYRHAYAELQKISEHSKMSTEQILVSSLMHGKGGFTQQVKLRLDLEFIDVNLYLKSNNRQLLHGITGKLMAGNVTAVMGPSGAGKSTFFAAVAGKVSGCRVTGQVLINGREEPIQAYRRIVGFVPQDDIVHGNLTVEENLWFSANYRLPNGMARTRKFLAVERTILALGLDYIRHNLVGTVEKRGISGGQRKRVNVGLEMVIEPSLLILDEPTSGLDSTASFLVLQALRREAARGVNIGVVLHQPSYKLFHMFDDIMFLGKGGKLVYLGPVSEVEGYFSSLGWVVPDRVNPPDQFMDVLGGLVESTKGVKLEDLPLVWVEHKGYRLRSQEEVALELGGVEKEKFFFTQVWGRFHDRWQHEVDEFREVLRPQPNLTRRVTPGFFKQLERMLARTIRQHMRMFPLFVQDYIIMLITGAALGYLAQTNDNQLGGAQAYTYTIIGLSLLGMIAALRTFGNDKLNYFRESASGINKLSYFVAKDVMDWPHILLKPLAYMGLFYFFNYPRSTFVDNYGITVCLFYCVTGIGYVLAITLPPGPAQLSAAVVSLIATLFTQRVNPKGLLKVLYELDFARWALEGYILINAKRYSGVWLLTRCAALGKLGFKINFYPVDIIMLLLFGLIARIGAFAALVFCNRDKQK